MAALVAGVKYGLSSQEPSYQDKSLIFVKLTDSAFKAIEEHLKNAAKSSVSPSIQFLGNEGHLTIPSIELPGGQARFNFSLSSNEDTQGSFECVKATGQRSLAALGALACKMRIQAKDDVYEATRHRVAAAEEQSKKNCTQVIKQSDLGKSKARRSTKWEEHRNERIAAIAAATAASQNGPGGRREYSRTRPPASVPRENNLLGLSKSSSPNNSYQRSSLHNKPQVNSDIAKRPLKEKLIHMLALRPYKKPELYDRAVREGYKGNNSPQFWMTVNSVASFKTNVYQLKREMWADVQEEWPFYSEQDRALLKRRKPQNLTPPGNSDGGSSVSSGQSPTSTHPGSPPSMISGISNKRPGYYETADGFQTKRQRISHYVKPSDPPQGNSSSLFSSGLPNLDLDSDCPPRSSNSPSRVERVPRPDRTDWPDRPDWSDRLDRQERDPNDRSDRPNQMDWSERNDWNDRGDRTERNDRGYRSDQPERFDRNERKDWNERSDYNRERRAYDSCDQENIQFQYKTDKRNSDNSAKEKSFAQKSESVNQDSLLRMGDSKVNGLTSVSDRGRSANSSSDRYRLSTSSMLSSKDRLSPLPRPRNVARDGFGGSDSSVDSRTNSKQPSSGDTRNSSIPRRSGEESRDGRESRDRVLSQMSTSRAQVAHHDSFDKTQSSAHSRLSAGQDRQSNASQYTYPEFLKEYTKIESGEQRRQYKADFNKDYREYQTLHQMVERVSQHFEQLEKRLRQEKEGSDAYKRIKDQIVQEYFANKKDAKLNESKKRFQYLHEKLSHIKKLVQEYDTSIQKGNADS